MLHGTPKSKRPAAIPGSVLISISTVMNGFLIGNRPKWYIFV